MTGMSQRAGDNLVRSFIAGTWSGLGPFPSSVVSFSLSFALSIFIFLILPIGLPGVRGIYRVGVIALVPPLNNSASNQFTTLPISIRSGYVSHAMVLLRIIHTLLYGGYNGLNAFIFHRFLTLFESWEALDLYCLKRVQRKSQMH